MESVIDSVELPLEAGLERPLFFFERCFGGDAVRKVGAELLSARLNCPTESLELAKVVEESIRDLRFGIEIKVSAMTNEKE